METELISENWAYRLEKAKLVGETLTISTKLIIPPTDY